MAPPAVRGEADSRARGNDGWGYFQSSDGRQARVRADELMALGPGEAVHWQ